MISLRALLDKHMQRFTHNYFLKICIKNFETAFSGTYFHTHTENAEEYLEPCPTAMMELFRENKWRLSAVNYLHKKGSQHTPLEYSSRNCNKGFIRALTKSKNVRMPIMSITATLLKWKMFKKINELRE